jgi:phosphoglycerate dehydrogenase-like enzyme
MGDVTSTRRRPRVALVADGDEPAFARAVRDAGGEVVGPADAEALVFGGDPVLLEAALHDGVRWVQLTSAGVEWLWAAGVIDGHRTWLAARGVYAEAVAEWCLAMLLAGARSLPARARAATWDRRRIDRLLAGSTVGIVGAGAIGRRLIELLAPFGVRTIALTRSGRDVPGASVSTGPDGLGELLAATDAVVLLAPATDATRRLIGAAELERMRAHAWLVNAGRGALVDTDALVAALRAGRIGGAALDVTDPEPLPDGHPLWSLPNALVTPHVANHEGLSVEPMARRIAENVARAASGRPLLGTVDPDAGY